MRPSWNEYFMVIAKIISTRSTCNSRPAGAVIVRDKQILSTGYNGSMPGAPHCSDNNACGDATFCFRRGIKGPEDDKYNFCRSIHAEANAVARAARLGISLDGTTLFATLAPCYVCLKQLASAGIKRIYYEYDYESTNKERDIHWKNAINESPIEAFEMLRVSEGTNNIIKSSLIYPTSRRRLSEDGKCIYTPIMKIYAASSNRQCFLKKALLSALTGRIDGDRFLGKTIEIEIDSFDERKLENKSKVKALEFLTSLNVIENNILTSSKLLTELTASLMLKRDTQTVANNLQRVTTQLINDKVHIIFNLFEYVDIWNHFEIIIDSAILIFSEIYGNLVERLDISFKKGSIKILINKPFLKRADKSSAEKLLTGEEQ